MNSNSVGIAGGKVHERIDGSLQCFAEWEMRLAS